MNSTQQVLTQYTYIIASHTLLQFVSMKFSTTSDTLLIATANSVSSYDPQLSWNSEFIWGTCVHIVLPHFIIFAATNTAGILALNIGKEVG